jgi:putative DNA primase/helicase
MNSTNENTNPIATTTATASPLRQTPDETAEKSLAGQNQLDWIQDVEPWPDPVNGDELLAALAATLRRFVVLPPGAEPALALWMVHTYAFELRNVATYVGIESPDKRCGKSTLLTVLSALVNRPIVASNISSPAFFRVIEEVRPTLLIDESDTFLRGNDELRGILNAGYSRQTAFVVRVMHQAENEAIPITHHLSPISSNHPLKSPLPITYSPSPSYSGSRLARFSSWCPKALAAIGRLPETLADRCIVIPMNRKLPKEARERVRLIEGAELRRKCARFIRDHAAAIKSAQPAIPSGLNDRAADIWEPLFVLADLAGGPWPADARKAALLLTGAAQEQNPITSLLLDLYIGVVLTKADRVFSRSLVDRLCSVGVRPWNDLPGGGNITERWLARQLRPYGVQPRTIRIGMHRAKGYFRADLEEVFTRYVPNPNPSPPSSSRNCIAGFQPAVSPTSSRPGIARQGIHE